MLRLTDAFVWEDLPLTDPDTGSLAMVAWVPRIQKVTTFIAGAGVIYHVIQSSIRISVRDGYPMIYDTRYPFDTTKSPAYELTVLTQVTNSVCIEILFCRATCIAMNYAVYTRVKIYASGLFYKINA